ncbi:MAG: DUF6088 family protein [Lachnospiraceae bacterium]|nr:DUF6088 family protein [Lachnospiraceae bacterium]
MKKVLEYIVEHYKKGEPIFISDIVIPDISQDNLKQQLKHLVDEKILIRYEKGIYYLPRESRLKSGFRLSADTVARYKYISRRGRTMGYYSGFTFANQIGISMQVPVKVEIVSNESAPIVRDITLGNRVFTVRKPRIEVTEDNQKVLQLLELLKDIEEYSDESADDVREQIVRYITAEKIARKEVDKYIQKYPMKIYKYVYEMRLENVFA